MAPMTMKMKTPESQPRMLNNLTVLEESKTKHCHYCIIPGYNPFLATYVLKLYFLSNYVCSYHNSG